MIEQEANHSRPLLYDSIYRKIQNRESRKLAVRAGWGHREVTARGFKIMKMF